MNIQLFGNSEQLPLMEKYMIQNKTNSISRSLYAAAPACRAMLALRAGKFRTCPGGSIKPAFIKVNMPANKHLFIDFLA